MSLTENAVKKHIWDPITVSVLGANKHNVTCEMWCVQHISHNLFLTVKGKVILKGQVWERVKGKMKEVCKISNF